MLTDAVLGGLLPAFEISFMVLHIVAYLAIIIPVACLGTPGNAAEIFTRFENTGGWASSGVAFFVGLQGMAGAFTGGDSAVNVSTLQQPLSRILTALVDGGRSRKC